MPRYNHAYTIAFALSESEHPDGNDVTPAMLKSALLKRVDDMDKAGDTEWLEAVSAPYDSYEEPEASEQASLQAMTFNVAMDIRAYGSVLVTATSLEQATSQLTAEFVSKHFQPHGGNDDLSYEYPSDIVVTNAYFEDTGEDIDMDELQVPDGKWIIKER